MRHARPDLVATVNSSTPKVFRNRVTTGKPLAIRLNCPKGNLRGIGSRVTLYLKSGKIRVAEVHSGSSYLTGSSPNVFLAIAKGDEAETITVRSPAGKLVRQEVRKTSGVVLVNLK